MYHLEYEHSISVEVYYTSTGSLILCLISHVSMQGGIRIFGGENQRSAPRFG
jgi:hypothetical protein